LVDLVLGKLLAGKADPQRDAALEDRRIRRVGEELMSQGPSSRIVRSTAATRASGSFISWALLLPV
jgi:hypothetical protein